MYLGLQKYINNWKRLGFNDSDLTRPISDRLVDAMIAYGTADAIAARLNEHLDAGADYVPIRVLIAEQTTNEASLGPPRWWLGWSVRLRSLGVLRGRFDAGP